MIYDIIQKIKDTPGTNDKISILKANKDNPVLKHYLYLTLSPRVRYHVSSKAVPETQSRVADLLDLEVILNRLGVVSTRTITGGTANNYVQGLMASTSPENEELIRNLLDANPKCGINYKVVNKVWNDLISYPEVQLASTDITRISYPAYSQLKADGARVLFQGGEFLTRNGSVIETHGVFGYLDVDIELDGEFVCFLGDTPLSRKESNGIINKAIKGTITPGEAQLIRYLVWDMPGKKPYSQRLKDLDELVRSHHNYGNLVLIESELVNDYEEAREHFQDVRNRGLEGTILKNTEALFEAKRSFNLCKLKAEYEADFKVVGFEYGTGKNSARVGNLLLESECGEVKTSCGIFKDFPEEIRDDWVLDTPSIVTVLYNERVTSKGRSTQSLFLPRVVADRRDKDEADTLQKMIEEENRVNGK